MFASRYKYIASDDIANAQRMFASSSSVSIRSIKRNEVLAPRFTLFFILKPVGWAVPTIQAHLVGHNPPYEIDAKYEETVY